MPTVSEAVFSIKDVAAACGCTAQTIRAWERTGRIPPATRVGGKRRYTSADITNVLELTRKPVYAPTERKLLDVEDTFAGLEAPEDTEAPGSLFEEELFEEDVPQPWAELEGGVYDHDWPPRTGRDRRGQPVRHAGPTCPHCGNPAHQVSLRGEDRWVCGEHGIVKPIRATAPSSPGLGSFPTSEPPRSFRRSLREGDVIGAIRLPRPTQPRLGAGYLDPAPQPTRPR
jgi:MerR family regulatory protein